MQNKSNVKRGFTLVEILIAVLIIGVLMSIAVPMYQSAIDKSRWAKLISPSKAIATAEEVILMSSGAYTVNKDDLAVSLPNNGEYDYQLYTTANGDDGNLVRVWSDKLEDVRLARHYEKDPKFPRQLYCEAKVGNARAKKLCEKTLQGSEVFTTDDGYKMYFLDGQMSEAVCEGANGFWSGSRNTCYQTQAEKCGSIGGNALAEGKCGWSSDSSHAVADDGLVCLGLTNVGNNAPNGCRYTIANFGGMCESRAQWNCRDTTVNNGGICLASAGSYGCQYATVKSGGICKTGTDSIYACSNSTIESGGRAECWSLASCESMHIEAGGVCERHASATCSGTDIYGKVEAYAAAGPRQDSNFHSGAVCEGYVANACSGTGAGRLIFHAGSKCIAKVADACKGATFSGGCCVADGGTCPAGTEC